MHYYQTKITVATSEDGTHLIARLYSGTNNLEYDKGWDDEPLQRREASELSRTRIEFETKPLWTSRLHSQVLENQCNYPVPAVYAAT